MVDMLSVSIVIPTRNEEDNITELLMQSKCFGEVIVVDDSDDNTPKLAKELGATVVKGQRKGLGQAIIDGINASVSDVVLVMDADLSHNPQDIPRLLKPILEQGADFVIGSRYIKGGDVSDWNLTRRMQSIIGVKLMQLVTRVSDSNSGFFCFRKSILEGVELKPHSWKIMLEVLFKGKWIFKTEVPIKFNDRKEGVSKNSVKERFAHAVHILRLLVWKFRRYITFACVGGIGALWYFSALYFLTEYIGIWYGLSAVIATFIAITNNYLINHFYTFRKEKQHNRSLWKGWFKYIANSAIGDGVDWCVLVFLTEAFGVWYMLSAFLASGVASAIKYTIARKYVWGGKGRKSGDCDYEWMAYFKGLPWQKRWKRIIARIVKEFAEVNGNAGKVLDIGGGSSPQGLLINNDDYICYDISNEKIRYMNSKRLDGCSFITGSFQKIEDCVLEGSIDTVLFIEVIEHLKNIAEARIGLGVIHDKLKSGGRLVVATPNFGGFMGRWMDRLYGIFQKNAYAEEHQLKFSLPMLRSLCERIGFRYVKSEIPSGADIVCLFEKV